ncbi:MAG: hypothetical protein K2K38_01360 [Clostridia bacterium]|nr:hypothetical protein [Clostridia bacterium]
MKLSVRRIVLLVLSIFVLGFGLYNIISAIVELPSVREQVLGMFSDPQISSAIPDPEKIVSVVLGITIAIACLVCAFYLATGILGLLASLGKYKGSAHIILTWIYLILCALGLIITIVGLVKGSPFDWTIILSILEVAVAITFIIIAKQIKEEEY